MNRAAINWAVTETLETDTASFWTSSNEYLFYCGVQEHVNVLVNLLPVLALDTGKEQWLMQFICLYYRKSEIFNFVYFIFLQVFVLKVMRIVLLKN